MTTVSGTSSTSTTARPAATTAGAGSLRVQEYISLLTTQLKYQDPTSPTDNTQMIAQMAQFSTLSGISDLNSTASNIKTSLGTLDTLNSSLGTISTKLDAILASQQAANTGTAA